MGVLLDAGLNAVNHYAPIHYLPFIARSGALLSKPSLTRAGFAQSHLRSMSRQHDQARGFGRFAFLTIDPSPRILRAKLAKGFPHIAICAPAAAIEKTKFCLSRYNIAMTRQLRRGVKMGFPESSTNGRYYGAQQIPIACNERDKQAMLAKHIPLGTMIEVLIDGDLALPDETEVIAFHTADATDCIAVLKALGRPWRVSISLPPGPYPRDKAHVASAAAFVTQAIADPAWRGNWLEFDRL